MLTIREVPPVQASIILKAAMNYYYEEGETIRHKIDTRNKNKQPYSTDFVYYNYIYVDREKMENGATLLDAAFYIGKGKGTRCYSHWKEDGSGCTRDNFLAKLHKVKAQGFKANECIWIVGYGFIDDDLDFKNLPASVVLDEEAAANRETIIIAMGWAKEDPVTNETYHWEPGFPTKVSMKSRKILSEVQKKRVRSTEETAKRKKETTNDLTLDLYKHDVFIHRFEGTSYRDISKWIKETHGEDVRAGSLYSTANPNSKQKTTGDGWRLHDVFGKMEKPDEKTSILIAMGQAKPAVIEHKDGRQMLVWSCYHQDCTSLGYDGGGMSLHFRRAGHPNGVSGWKGRFLIDTEIVKLMKLAPVFHNITVDGVEHKLLNTNLFCREQGIANGKGKAPPNLLKVLKGRQSYAILNHKRVTGSTIYTGRPMAQMMTPEMLSMLDAPIIIRGAKTEWHCKASKASQRRDTLKMKYVGHKISRNGKVILTPKR